MPKIIHTTNFVADAANLIIETATSAIAERDRFFLALSGGSTPQAIYEKLRELAPDTSKWVITFGDERCVPPDDKQSNFRMASEAWLKHSDAIVLRMKGELEPEAAAEDYEVQLNQFSNFTHDLILLGMGDDGHTASLFPETAALQEKDRRVVSNYVPKLGVWRITLTFPFLNVARQVVFLVNGKAKQPLVETILTGGTNYPSEQIKPTSGNLTWLLGD